MIRATARATGQATRSGLILPNRPVLFIGLVTADLTRIGGGELMGIETADLTGMPPVRIILLAAATHPQVRQRITGLGGAGHNGNRSGPRT